MDDLTKSAAAAGAQILEPPSTQPPTIGDITASAATAGATILSPPTNPQVDDLLKSAVVAGATILKPAPIEARGATEPKSVRVTLAPPKPGRYAVRSAEGVTQPESVKVSAPSAPVGYRSAAGAPPTPVPPPENKESLSTGKESLSTGTPAGLIEPGNIDLAQRKPVTNPDGTVSTVRSIGINQDGREVLIPTVVNGKVVSDAEATAHYQKTGEHLGVFDTAAHATAHAKNLHAAEAARISTPDTMSADGIEALKDREGGFYEAPYQDRGGLAIGYGMQTWQGEKVTKDLRISLEQADAELDRQLRATYIPIVKDALHVPVTQPQFDALVSLAYNSPRAAIQLAQKLNRGETLTQDDWRQSTPNVNQGRRDEEHAQFSTPPEQTRPAPIEARGVTLPESVHVTEPGGIPPVPSSARRFTGLQPLTGRVADPLTEGVQQVGHGFGELTKGIPPVGVPPSGPLPKPSGDELFNAGADLLEGAIKLSTPLMVAGVVAAPLKSAIVLAGSYLTAHGAEQTVAYLGGSPAAQRFVGALAGAIGAGVVGSETLKHWAGETTRAVAVAGQLSGRATGIEGTPAEALAPGPRAPISQVVTQPEAFVEHGIPGGETAGDVVRTALAPEPPPLAVGQGRDRSVPLANADEVVTALHGEKNPDRILEWALAQDITQPAGRTQLAAAITELKARGVELPQAIRNLAQQAVAFVQSPAHQDVAAVESGRALERRLTNAGPPPGTEERRRATVESFAPAEPQDYSFGSTQMNLPPAIANQIRALGATIPEKDLAHDGVGVEDQPHVTVKYGLHTDDPNAVRDLLKDEPPVAVTLGKLSIFPDSESGHGDVIKAEVDSPDLHRLNKTISDALEHTDTHPEYTPHVTIAYVKPGKGKEIIQALGADALQGQSFTLDHLSFSTKNGQVFGVQLEGAPHAVETGEGPQDDQREHRGADQVGAAAEGSGGGGTEQRPPAPVAETQEVAPLVPAPLTEAERARWSVLIKKDRGGRLSGDAGHLVGAEKAEHDALTHRGTAQAYMDTYLRPMSDERLQEALRQIRSPANKSRQLGLPVIAEQEAQILAVMKERGLEPEPTPESPPSPNGEKPAEAPKSRLLIVDTVTGKTDVSAGRELGRKEVLVAEKQSGEIHILRSGDQVSPAGRSKILKGNYAAPEAAVVSGQEPLSATGPQTAEPGNVVVPDTKIPVPEPVSTEKPVQEVAKVSYNKERHSIEIKFPAKPAPELLQKVREGGYRWAKTNKVWYRKLTPRDKGEAGVAAAKKLLGIATAPPTAPLPTPQEPVTFEVKTIFGEKRPDVTLPPATVTPGFKVEAMGGIPVSGTAAAAAAPTFKRGDHVDSWQGPGEISEIRGTDVRLYLDATHSYSKWMPLKDIKPLGAGQPTALAQKLNAHDWYHGTSTPVSDLSALKAPFYVSISPTAADWFTTRSSGKAETIYRLKVTVRNPFSVGGYDDAVVLADLLRKAGIDVKLTPESPGQGWEWEVPAVETEAGYDGYNPIDVSYLPKARAALQQAGYDSMHAIDPLENTEHEVLALFSPKTQVTNYYESQAAPWKDDEDVAALEYLLSEKAGIHGKNVARANKSRLAISRGELPKTKAGVWTVDNDAKLLEAADIVLDKYPLYLATINDADLGALLDAIPDVLADPEESGLYRSHNGERLIDWAQVERIGDLTATFEREFARRAGQESLDFEPQKAQTQAEEIISGRAPQRRDLGTGQLPVSGGPAAVRGGTGSQGTLETVPAESGGGPAAPRRGASAGHGDTSGVVAQGVRHAPRAGAESGVAPPGVAATLSGRPVSPAGDHQAPGETPPDYALTPERIAAIVARGPMQRAKDNLAAIRLAKQIRAAARYATPAEQDVLARYVGWGDSDVAHYLADRPEYDWRDTEKALWQEIQDATTPEERKALQLSTINAHFTFDLFRPMWDALTRAGFAGGRVLEPAVGTGHAIGLMPPGVRTASTINGVELEPLSATIAQLLYPSMRVQAVGYEQARIARNSQDLVIGNPPFGKYGVRDPKLPAFLTDPDKGGSIHNYFFAKALSHVRPGGLVLFITSRYTMDGQEATAVRRYLMERAEFLGAVRLPNTAFDKSAKTEVVTDVIALRKFDDEAAARQKMDVFNPAASLFIEAPKSETLSSVRTDWRGRVKSETHVFRSRWYDEHPDLILGTETTEGTMYGPGQYTVTATTEQIADALGAALQKILPAGTYEAATTAATTTEEPAPVQGAFKAGEFRVTNGVIMSVDRDGQLHDATPTRTQNGQEVVDKNGVQRLTGMIGIRNALRELVAAMRNVDASDAAIKAGQKKLTKLYDAFVADHGTLNLPINRRLFLPDPEAANLLGLELITPRASVVTDRTGKKTLRISYDVTGRSKIFTTRTIQAPKVVTHADSPHDALLAALSTKARIDWPYMASLTGQSASELQAALTADSRVFEQPDGQWVLAEDYLSGDVVSKLHDAEAAAADDPARYRANVEALKAIQPAPKTPEEITIPLGGHWIEPAHITQFVRDELGLAAHQAIGDISVVSTETYVRWSVDLSVEGQNHALAVRYGPNENRVYSFVDLLTDTLNLKQPSLGWYEGSGKDRVFVKDPTGTTAARANQEELRSHWRQWVSAHPDVERHLTDTYNTRFNRTVKRQWDGSHLANVTQYNTATGTGERTAALPGLALPFPLHPHQRNFIWRGLTGGNTLAGHEVGAGKTYAMAVLAMEYRRIGRARKPLITVPTYLLGQWRQAILEAYPSAKVLAFDDKDLEKSKRQQAMARIAYGDWDIVLVPHSSFQLLKVSDARLKQVFEAWVQELSDAESAARDSDGEDAPSVKELARQRRRIEDKITKVVDRLNAGSDNGLTWEDLGVDALFVDEAHLFKNLHAFTQLEHLRGLSLSESDRALGLYVKVQDINEQSGHRNLVLATATPVMNSMAEIFTMQRYLQPQTLREHGLENFDNWYRMFALALPTVEQRPDGTYQEVMRLRAFQNLDALYRMFSEVMDYVGWDDMPYLKLPTLKGGKIQIIQTEPHPMYAQLKEWFAQRLAAIKDNPPHHDPHKSDGWGPKGHYIAPERMDPLTGKGMGRPDNILTVMTDAKLAAVDVRLVLGSRATDVPGSRLQTAANELARIYKEETPKKGVQLVFLDVGTPRQEQLQPLEFLKGVKVEDQTGGAALGTEEEVDEDDPDEKPAEPDNANGAFNLYDALRDALIKRGVPSREIAYVHQARNAGERLALFQAANEGKVRFVFASTEKGGMGMNIQTRLVNVTHFDAPRAMRPGDLQQRRGRGIRQGNTYPEIYEQRYVTKGTTDEWLYGLLSQKSTVINLFMRGGLSEYQEEDPSTMGIEEAMMRASNDKRAIELQELRSALNRLKAQADAQERAIGRAKFDLDAQTKSKAHIERDLATLETWLKTGRQDVAGEKFRITIGGTEYTTRKEANARLIDQLREVVKNKVNESVAIGTFGGLTLSARYDWVNKTDRGAVLSLDARPASGGLERVATIAPPKDPKEPFGLGRDLVASLENDYSKLPHLGADYRARLGRVAEATAAAQKVLDRPADALGKLRAAQARISDLETTLKVEGAAQDKERAVEQKARAAGLEIVRDTEGKALLTKDGEYQTRPRQVTPSGDASAGTYATGGVIAAAPRPGSVVLPAGAGALQQIQHIEFPELVDFARELSETPQVVRRFRNPDVQGKFGGGQIRLAAGLFRKGNEHQLAATLAHEIGHLVDWLPDQVLKRGNLLGRLQTLRGFLKHSFTAPNGPTIKLKDVRDELQALSDLWRPWDPTKASTSFKAYRHSSKELYADALSVLLNNPGLLEEKAPTFYKQFFEHLDQKPDVAVAFFELQEVLARTPEDLIARRRARLRAGFAEGSEKALELEARKRALVAAERHNLGQKLRLLFQDRNAAVRDLFSDTRAGRAATLPEDENPIYFLSERSYIGGVQKAFLDRTVEPIYRAILDSGATWEDFGEALFNSRVLTGDRSELANPHGLQPQAVQASQEELERTLGPDRWRIVQQAMADLRGVAKGMADAMHDAGLFTDELHRTIQTNPAYAPFQVVEYADREVNWTVKRQVGTLKAVSNPADTFVMKLLSSIRALERQRMLQALVHGLQQQHPGAIQPARTRWNGRFHEALEPEDRDLGLIHVYDKGRPTGYYVHEHIAWSANNESIGRQRMLMWVLNLISGAPIFRPLYTTFNLGFLMFHATRDFERFWINTPGLTLGRAIANYARAVPVARLRAFGPPRDYRPGGSPVVDATREKLLQAQEAKLLSLTHNDIARRDPEADSVIESIFATHGMRDYQHPRHHPAVRPFFALLDRISQIGDFIFTLPKIAGAEYFSGGRAYRDLTPAQRLFIRESLGSPDILTGGTMTPFTNKLLLYSNIAIQGWTADLRLFRRPKVNMPPVPARGGGVPPVPPPEGGASAPGWEYRASGIRWKLASAVFLPKLLMYAALLGAFGEATRRILQGGSSEYDRTNYLVVPIGEDVDGTPITLRLPQSPTERIIGGLFWKLLGVVHGDKDLATGLAGLLDYTGGALPSLAPTFTSLKQAWQYAEGQRIYDPFRNRFVESDLEYAAGGLPRLKKFLGYEFQELGGAIVWKFYAGEDRPAVKTPLQTFLDLPVVSNLAGRFVKSTNYGEIEQYRQAAAGATQQIAERQLAEHEGVTAAVTQMLKLPPPQRTELQIKKLASDIVQTVYPEGPAFSPTERAHHFDTVTKKIDLGMQRYGAPADALTDVVLGERSTDEKVAAMLEGRRLMGDDVFNRWLSTARAKHVVTEGLLAHVLEAERRQDAGVPLAHSTR